MSRNTLEKLKSSKFKTYHVSGFPRTEDAGYDYDYDNINKDDDMMATPKFVSLPQSVMVKEGETVRLPCIVDRLEGFVLIWKRGPEIITVANQVIDTQMN